MLLGDCDLFSIRHVHLNPSPFNNPSPPIWAIRLSDAVATIDDDIVASGVCASIRHQVDIRTLQLLRITITAHGNHALPQILDLLVDEVREPSINVAWGDAVDSRKVTPLVGQRLGHMNAARLRNVVARLLLREVGNMTRHGARDDEAARLTLLEVMAHGLRAVEGARQIRRDDFVPVLDGPIEDTAVGGAARVGDEGVDLAEVLDDLLDEGVDVLPAADVELVGLALDAVFLGQLFCVLLAALGAGGVGDGDVGAELCGSAGSFNAHAPGAGGTGDDDDLSLEGEEVLELGLFGDWDHACGILWEVFGLVVVGKKGLEDCTVQWNEGRGVERIKSKSSAKVLLTGGMVG
jgi:hypothetical protein